MVMVTQPKAKLPSSYERPPVENFSDNSNIDDYTVGKIIGTRAYAEVRVGLYRP